MTFLEIARGLGVRPAVVGQLWRQLTLPDRAQFKILPAERAHRSYERRKEQHRRSMYAWRKRNADRERVIRLRATNRWRHKLLREERCIICGSVFAWTNGHEQRHRQRGQRVVCSARCGTHAAISARIRTEPSPRTGDMPDAVRRPASARERILGFVAKQLERPPTAREIAAACGCSRQYVYATLPAGFVSRRPHIASRLQDLVESNPDAVRPKVRGGLTFKEIAASLDVEPRVISRLWHQLGLPDRRQFTLSRSEQARRAYERHRAEYAERARLWRERNPEKAHAIRRRADQRWRHKVLREERCAVCGSAFPWTNALEQKRRLRGRPVVCSGPCALRVRAATDSQPRAPTSRARRIRGRPTIS